MNTEMKTEVICENYEISIGEGGSGVVLTFDIDDIEQVGLSYVKSLEIDEKGFHVTLSPGPVANEEITALFPMQEGMEPLIEEIRQSYGRMYVAALGDGEEAGSSKIVFAREMLLS